MSTGSGMQRKALMLLSFVLICSLAACRGRRRIVGATAPDGGGARVAQNSRAGEAYVPPPAVDVQPGAGETLADVPSPSLGEAPAGAFDGPPPAIALDEPMGAPGAIREPAAVALAPPTGTGSPFMTPPAGLPRPDEGDEGEPADPEAYLRAQAADARVNAEQREVLINQLLAKADAALSAGDVAAARTFYGKVLNIDSSNARAQDGWRRLSDDRVSATSDYLDQAQNEELVRRSQAATEVRAHLQRGRALEAKGDFDAAIKEYRSAHAIISWYDETADFGITASGIRDLISATQRKAELDERRAREEQLREAQQEQEAQLLRERERRLGRMYAYYEQANVAFRRGDYALARQYATQILREDPSNQEAAQLIRVSHDAEHYRNQKSWREQFDDQWKSIMRDIEAKSLPQVATVEFPSDWLTDIAIRTPRSVGSGEIVEDASAGTILATLESKRVSNLTWSEEPLTEAIAYLRTITGLNFFLSNAAQEDKGDATLNFTLDDVSVKNILDMITDYNEMKWYVKDGIVYLANADEVSGTMRLEYFDIKDLNVLIEHFAGQEINLTPSNYTPPDPPELPEAAPIFPGEALPDLIRDTIGGEGAWEDPASVEVSSNGGILLVYNTNEMIGQVGQLLDELRANTGVLVNLEVRFLTAEDNFLRDVGVDVRGLGDNSQGIGLGGLGTASVQDDVFFGSPGNPFGVPFGVNPEPSSVGTANDTGIFYNDGADGAYSGRVENLFDMLLGNPGVLTGSGGLSFQHTFLDDTQMEVILRAVEKSERIQQIDAPRITVYNTQRANVQVLNQVAYVADYEVEIAQASNIANPVVQRILDGIVLDVKPVVSADRRFVNLELRPTVANLTRPIGTFSTSLASSAANAPVVIQIPELRVSRVRTTVNMPDGGTLLLGGLKFYEQEDFNSGVPFLSDIPIVSFLLERQGSYVNRRNLLVLIRAEIVNLEELAPRDELNVPEIPSDVWVPVIPPQPCEACGSPCETKCGCR